MIFQTLRIETRAQQPGLSVLHVQQSSGWASREFAFDRTEHARDHGPAAVEPLRECSPNFLKYSTHALVYFPCLAGITLWVPRCCRRHICSPARSNTASANTGPRSDRSKAAPTTAGKSARSFQRTRHAVIGLVVILTTDCSLFGCFMSLISRAVDGKCENVRNGLVGTRRNAAPHKRRVTPLSYPLHVQKQFSTRSPRKTS